MESLLLAGLIPEKCTPLRIYHLEMRLEQLKYTCVEDYCDSGKPQHDGYSLFLRESDGKTQVLVIVDAIPGIRKAEIGWVDDETLGDYAHGSYTIMQPDEVAAEIASQATLNPEYHGDTIRAVPIHEYCVARYERVKAEIEQLKRRMGT